MTTTKKRRPGRPPFGKRAKTQAEKNAELRAKDLAAGKVDFKAMVDRETRDEISRLADERGVTVGAVLDAEFCAERKPQVSATTIVYPDDSRTIGLKFDYVSGEGPKSHTIELFPMLPLDKLRESAAAQALRYQERLRSAKPAEIESFIRDAEKLELTVGRVEGEQAKILPEMQSAFKSWLNSTAPRWRNTRRFD